MVACDFVCRDGLCIFVVVKSFKDIVADWRREFPLLKPYTPTWLAMTAGPVMVGIRLTRFYGIEYRVYLDVYPLWSSPDKISSWQLFNIGLTKDLRKSGMSIDYEDHDRLFGTAAACAHKYFDVILQEVIPIEKLELFIDTEIRMSLPEHLISFWADVCEFKMALAVYGGSAQMIMNAKNWIRDEVRFWDEDNVRALYSMTKGEWVDDLYARYADRDAFMARIAENMAQPRIARLNSAELVYDPAKIVPYRRGIWSRMRLWVALLRFRLRELRIKIYHRINL